MYIDRKVKISYSFLLIHIPLKLTYLSDVILKTFGAPIMNKYKVYLIF